MSSIMTDKEYESFYNSIVEVFEYLQDKQREMSLSWEQKIKESGKTALYKSLDMFLRRLSSVISSADDILRRLDVILKG